MAILRAAYRTAHLFRKEQRVSTYILTCLSCAHQTNNKDERFTLASTQAAFRASCTTNPNTA